MTTTITAADLKVGDIFLDTLVYQPLDGRPRFTRTLAREVVEIVPMEQVLHLPGTKNDWKPGAVQVRHRKAGSTGRANHRYHFEPDRSLEVERG